MPTDDTARALIASLTSKVDTQVAALTKQIDGQSATILSLRKDVDALKPDPTPSTTTIFVKRGDNLQAAIDQAATLTGSVQIRCQPGAYPANFTLKRNKQTASTWITIRPDVEDGNLTAATPWIQPGNTALVRLVSPNNGTTLTTEPGAGRYWLTGLDFPPNAGSTSVDLVVIGTGLETALSQLPYDIVLDRCYLHGDPIKGQHRGLAFHVINGQILSSYFENFFESGRQSQAIATWNTPGPITLRNSYVEGASECFLCGGDTVRLPNVIPSDIEVSGNLFTKRAEWQSRTDVKLNVANLIEFKLGRRVRVFNNVFDRNWPDAQGGAGIVVTVRNEYGATNWATIEDFLFEYNAILNVQGPAVNTMALDDRVYASVQGKTFTMRHNLVHNCDNGIQVNRGFLPTTVSHNTFTKINNWVVQFPTKMSQPGNFVFESNVAPLGSYGVTGDGSTGVGKSSLDGMAPGYSVAKNAWQRGSLPMPAGNYDVADLQAMFDAKKRYLGTELGTDGVKVGANVDEIIRRIPWATW